MIGITSKFYMVPMDFVIIAGNESGKTWTRTTAFCRKHYLSLGMLHTVISDGNKGIPIGIDNVFSEDEKLSEVASAHHRVSTIEKHGKSCS